jgi:hypothetical protein
MLLDYPDKDLKVPEDRMSDEDMIHILAEKVQAYLDVNINLLMSYLYRLDVLEKDIKKALDNSSEEAGHYALARLIWDRQKKRIETKKLIKVNPEIDDDLSW